MAAGALLPQAVNGIQELLMATDSLRKMLAQEAMASIPVLM